MTRAVAGGFRRGVVAERAFTTRPTLRRVEQGDHGVGMGICAAVLQALGLLDGLGQVADPSNDKVDLALSSEALPERVRLRRREVKNDAR